MTKPPAMPEPLGWYVVNNIGMATLCADKQDATQVAVENSIQWPNLAPHRAMQLCDAGALQSAQPAEVSDEEAQADRLEAALESIVNLCNNDLVLCNSPEVIAAEATLERLYRARTTPKDATVTAQPSIPEACQFEPKTAPEAFLQQEMAELLRPTIGITQRADGGEG